MLANEENIVLTDAQRRSRHKISNTAQKVSISGILHQMNMVLKNVLRIDFKTLL